MKVFILIAVLFTMTIPMGLASDQASDRLFTKVIRCAEKNAKRRVGGKEGAHLQYKLLLAVRKAYPFEHDLKRLHKACKKIRRDYKPERKISREEILDFLAEAYQRGEYQQDIYFATELLYEKLQIQCSMWGLEVNAMAGVGAEVGVAWGRCYSQKGHQYAAINPYISPMLGFGLGIGLTNMESSKTVPGLDIFFRGPTIPETRNGLILSPKGPLGSDTAKNGVSTGFGISVGIGFTLGPIISIPKKRSYEKYEGYILR